MDLQRLVKSNLLSNANAKESAKFMHAHLFIRSFLGTEKLHRQKANEWPKPPKSSVEQCYVRSRTILISFCE